MIFIAFPTLFLFRADQRKATPSHTTKVNLVLQSWLFMGERTHYCMSVVQGLWSFLLHIRGGTCCPYFGGNSVPILTGKQITASHKSVYCDTILSLVMSSSQQHLFHNLHSTLHSLALLAHDAFIVLSMTSLYADTSGGSMGVWLAGKQNASCKTTTQAMGVFWCEPAKATMENLPFHSCKCTVQFLRIWSYQFT